VGSSRRAITFADDSIRLITPVASYLGAQHANGFCNLRPKFCRLPVARLGVFLRSSVNYETRMAPIAGDDMAGYGDNVTDVHSQSMIEVDA
jgi:hypothetical protein